jgi:hypothetical protein
MKTQLATQLLAICLLLAATPQATLGQNAVFTYQGRVTASGTNFTGTGRFKFALATSTNASYTTRWSNDGTSSAGSEPVSAVSVPVNGGLFTVGLGDTSMANMTAIDPAIFAQPGLQLRIWFNDGVNGFAALEPPQRLTPAPYAIFAGSANAGGLTGVIPAASLGGTYSNAVTLTNAANIFAGDGVGLTNVDAAKLGGFSASDFWRVGGNNVALGQFLGTTNNQPLELWVNNARALRLEPTLNDANHSNLVNVVGGSPANTIASGVCGSVIAGGGGTYFGFPFQNSVAADLAFLGGGWRNSIQTNADESVLVGGSDNSIETNAHGSVLVGGGANSIETGAFSSVLVGGEGNRIQTNASDNVLCGGWMNSIEANVTGSFLGGGWFNAIGPSPLLMRSVLGGGESNRVQGSGCFLGGGRFNSILGADGSVLAGGHHNSIRGTNGFASFLGGGSENSIGEDALYCVLSGGGRNCIETNATFSVLGGGHLNSVKPSGSYSFLGGGSLNTNAGRCSVVPGGRLNYAGGEYSFAAGIGARAIHDRTFVWSDGMGFEITSSTTSNQFVVRASRGYILYSGTGSSGVSLAAGGGAWTSLSDRNAKENFEPVDTKSVLAKVATLPLNTWNYKSQPASVRHIGPTAQDFKAAFAVGETDTGISTVDADGVALAAIQGLNQKLEAELSRRDVEISELKARLERLEHLLKAMNYTRDAAGATLAEKGKP